jgi:hypothetical protein
MIPVFRAGKVSEADQNTKTVGALTRGAPQRRPFDGRLSGHVLIAPIGCEIGVASQIPFDNLELKPDRSPYGQIGAHGIDQHGCTPGQGMATSLSKSTSTFAYIVVVSIDA